MPRGIYDRHPQDEPEQPAMVDARDAMIAKLLERIDSIEADYTVLARRVLASEDQPAALSQAEAEKKAPPLESVQNERARILAAWAAEQRVMISIAPDVNDEHARAAMRANAKRAGQPLDAIDSMGYPPRVFRVNGVELAVPVGELTSVPQSIADMYAYTLNPWKARRIMPPITFEQAEASIGVLV